MTSITLKSTRSLIEPTPLDLPRETNLARRKRKLLISSVRPTFRPRKPRINLDLVADLNSGTTLPTARLALETSLVVLARLPEAPWAAKAEEASPVVAPDPTVLERRRRRDPARHPEAANDKFSVEPICLLINAYSNKLSSLYIVNLL